MALARNVPQASISLKAGRWDRKLYTGNELNGKTIGVVGLGRIGREVARMCHAFGMTVLGYDPLSSAAEDHIEVTPLDGLLARSDFITMHVPKTKDTANLINKHTIAKCKQGVRIINCARGGIIHQGDLLEALESGHVGGAALDVYDSEPPSEDAMQLLRHPNVLCTPHLGASTSEAQVNVARDIAHQFVDALTRNKYTGVVNASRMDYVGRADLAPLLDLAERVGALQAQLMSGSGRPIRTVTVHLQGREFANAAISPVLKNAVLKGLLGEIKAEGSVNFVNTPMLAQEAGLNVETSLDSHKAGNFGNLIKVRVGLEGDSAAEGRTITAALTGNQPRLVQLDGFDVDIKPAGNMLFFRNSDRPGVLRDITAVLGRAGVNIANFNLGRDGVGGNAVGVLTLDAAVPALTLEELKEIPNLQSVATASLTVPATNRIDLPEDLHAGVRATAAPRPAVKPSNPQFGSGPTTKRPGWSVDALAGAALGRSHRSAVGKNKLKYAVDFTADLMQLPEGYRVGIVPGSDTGAYEMAMWSMLGPRPVDVLHWESFGKGWYSDAKSQLKLPQLTELTADYGHLPDLSKANTAEHDVLFTWNGTTSGVRVPNGDWIAEDRKGLTFVDATSAVFAQDIPFDKTDVLTYSWQKVLGGEGAHGMMVLSPAAVERLESYTPTWPMPKVFRMTKGNKLIEGIFRGETINTPSMLCVEDYIDALQWAEANGGYAGLVKRADANLAVIEKFVQENDWIDFLPVDPATRSNTSVCLSVALPAPKIKAMTALLEAEGVAFDIGAYRDAPPGLRIWCGATVEKSDMEALMPWLRWAFTVVSSD